MINLHNSPIISAYLTLITVIRIILANKTKQIDKNIFIHLARRYKHKSTKICTNIAEGLGCQYFLFIFDWSYFQNADRVPDILNDKFNFSFSAPQANACTLLER